LTSTLIAKSLYKTLKVQLNLKVRMDMSEKIFGGYKIRYEKAWRAK